MFDDLFSLTSQHMRSFSDTVRDQFGQSIILEVFEPMLQNISSLQQAAEIFHARATEIDQISEELKSIGNTVYE